MKCLSLWQPWASLLVTGHKRVETRSWPIRHRGPLLIHAAKKWNNELWHLCRQSPFKEGLADIGHALASGNPKLNLPFGAIIGRVDVDECYETERLTGARHADGSLVVDSRERAFGDYTPGRFAFLCSNPVRFDKPIPFRGLQGLFNAEITDGEE